jgi:hypothetical protein
MRAAVAAWDRFWFAPEPTSTLALVRIAFGLVVLVWACSLLPVVEPLFSATGVLPTRLHDGNGMWTVLDAADSGTAVAALLAALIVAACAVVAGFMTRLATVVVFVALCSFSARNPLVLNSGDTLLRGTAFFLMLAPAGAALSLDARRRRGRGRAALPDFPARAPWALRLIQVQLSVLYLSSVWTKLRGTTWNDGTALGYALSLDDLKRLPFPSPLLDSAVVVNALTWGTLAIELALALLIWNRAARPWVIAAGLALHLGIDYSLRVGVFGLAVFVSYVAFVPAPAASRFIVAVRGRGERAWRRLGAQLAAATRSSSP